VEDRHDNQRGEFAGKIVSPRLTLPRARAYKKFKIGELYSKVELKSKAFNKRKDTSKVQTQEFPLPLVNAKHGDNGIMYYGRSEIFDSTEMTIDIVQNGAIATGDVYPQPQRTGVLWDAYLIKARSHTDNEWTLCYIASAIYKAIKPKYSYEHKAYWKLVSNDCVELPVTATGEIDFAFMEVLIRELEAERIRELTAYLKASGLTDSKLSVKERKALADFDKMGFGEFRLEEIFNIEKTAGFDSDRLVDGNEYDYITRKSCDQGILKSTGRVNGEEINAARTWSLDLLQMNFFYRTKPWYAGQFIRKITPKIPMSEFVSHFFTVIMNKQKKHLRSVLVREVDATFKSSKVMLPVTPSGLPDYDYIEMFMRAVQKLVVKDVVDFAAKRISATKKCVKGGSRLMENLAEAPEEEEALRLAADENCE